MPAVKRWLIDRLSARLRRAARRGRAAACDEGGALFLTVLVVYVWLAPVTVVDGDNAELSALGAVGGRAHPPGYPLYVLYLRATSWLPGATPAHSAAIATCVLGACAVLVLHAACRAWGARPIAATVACALYAASPIVLRTHTEAEVFALNALLVASIVWVAAPVGPVRGTRRVALLGLLAGLGLANQLTCVLVAPVGLLGAVRGVRESRIAAIAAGVGGLALGLAPYLYLAIADGPISWGQVDGPGDIWRFFTRADYGGAMAFQGGQSNVGGQLGLLAASLGRADVVVFALLGLGFLGLRCVRGDAASGGAVVSGGNIWGWRMLAASFLLCGPLLVTQFDIALDGFGPYVCRRFHLQPLLLLAVPIAVGLDAVAQRIGDKLAGLRRAATPLACAGMIALTVVALPRLRAQHSPAMERGTEYLLASAPDRAVIVCMADDIGFTAQYLQHARGLRPDVTVIPWAMASFPWYRPEIARAGLTLEPYAHPISRAQALRFLATGRPLLVEQGTDGALGDLPRYPIGVAVRVLPPGSELPSPVDIMEQNRALFATFDLDYPRPGKDDDWATIVHIRYARTWRDIGRMLATGDASLAAAAREVALSYYPTSE